MITLSTVKTVQSEIVSNCRYYLSLVLGSLCVICAFLFLFLVPLVLDPAISTLMHDFEGKPVTCAVSSVSVIHGKSNCKWSSCREGCTADMYVCYQVRVTYSKEPYSNGSSVKDITNWAPLQRLDKVDSKQLNDTPLLINIKGCGYPPMVNCGKFVLKYTTLMEDGGTFPCYYSRSNPWVVLESYNYWATMTNLLAATLVPNLVFLVSISVLLAWHCQGCLSKQNEEEEGNLDENEELAPDIEEAAEEEEEPQNVYI